MLSIVCLCVFFLISLFPSFPLFLSFSLLSPYRIVGSIQDRKIKCASIVSEHVALFSSVFSFSPSLPPFFYLPNCWVSDPRIQHAKIQCLCLLYCFCACCVVLCCVVFLSSNSSRDKMNYSVVTSE